MLKLVFLSVRKAQNEFIQFRLTEDGWLIEHRDAHGSCDKAGRPFLQQCFYINQAIMPPSMEKDLSTLWAQAHQNRWNEKTLQQHFDRLGNQTRAFTLGAR